tara:strand:- start:5421 stop:6218 length:798 start_codon:yes stop_codon:yes gene_type:complete
MQHVMGYKSALILWFVTIFMLLGCTPVPSHSTAQDGVDIDTEGLEVNISENSESSANVSRQHRRTVKMSKDASVVVWGSVGGRRVVSGTGTYFEHKGYHIVITAYHVYDDPRIEGALVQSQSGEMVAGTIIYSNADRDICVLLVPQMRTVDAARLNPIRPSQADEGLSVLYTGFPGHHSYNEPLTFNGTLAGISDSSGFIIMQSYAWMGSSGSGVFDTRGRYVGVLVAIDVERGIYGPQLQENVVYVSPIWAVGVEEIEGILEGR